MQKPREIAKESHYRDENGSIGKVVETLIWINDFFCHFQQISLTQTTLETYCQRDQIDQSHQRHFMGPHEWKELLLTRSGRRRIPEDLLNQHP